MYRKYLTLLLGLGLVSVMTLGCGKSAHGVRMEGSNTMMNLAQAWAEKYHKAHPETTIDVLGGDSAAGIASLIEGTCDLANASREMEPNERERIKTKYGVDAQAHIVGFDALAVYVHKDNPLDSISIEELAEIYGENGKINKWSQLGVNSKGLRKAKIIRVSPPNSSGTYAYFQEAVLENKRDYKLGSIDQIGSKDLVATIRNAIGYGSLGNVAPGVKMLKISAKKGEPGIAPTVEKETCYPLTRSLLIYTAGEPKGQAKEFLDWILGPEGQGLVAQLGYVPVEE
jgi:phosphate transport system substrate-binding protein